MAFELNRIDGTLVLPFLRPENVSVRHDLAVIELRLSSEVDVELYFPAPGGVIEPNWLELAADVMIHLTEIDNEVQRFSAGQWAGTSYPSSHFEGVLAHITLTDPDKAVFCYYVIGCNSEWDERFVRTACRWTRVE